MNLNYDLSNDVVLNIQFGSTNSKTGQGIQTFFLPKKMIQKGELDLKKDKAVCFDCPFSRGRGCYVPMGMSGWGLRSKIRSLHKKKDFPHFYTNMGQILAHMKDFTYLRLGSYGEPILLPLEFMESMTKVVSTWTGYTHQWRNPQYADYSKYLMASVHSLPDAQEAEANGWRWFWVIDKKHPPQHVSIVGKKLMFEGRILAINCPASKESKHVSTCNRCGLCAGTSKSARNIWIYKH